MPLRLPLTYQHLWAALQEAADADCYTVAAILGARTNARGQREYRVQWAGYPAAQATWEPQKNLIECHEAIRLFEHS